MITKRYPSYYDASIDDETLDPELASPTSDGLMSKEDKIKLDKLTVGDSTPTNVQASDVIVDSEHRFVTDAEKTTWNSKANNTLATSQRAGLMSAADKQKLDRLSSGSSDSSSANLRVPASNVICDPEHRFVTDTLISKIESTVTSYDENVFSFNSDGSLNLKGFNTAESGTQLLKGADGQLIWSKPASTQGLQDAITKLQSDVTDLTSIVSNKVNADAVYTKDEVDLLISTSIANVNHLQRKKVTSVDEIDTSTENFIYMITKTDGTGNDHFDEYMVIEGQVEKIGSTAVDLTGYVKTFEMETALSTKVDKVEGKGLSTNDLTDELVAKINSISDMPTTIKINGIALPMVNREVNIAVASSVSLGVVKSSTSDNKVSVNDEGEMEINNINVNKLVQDEGDYLTLSAGASDDYF